MPRKIPLFASFKPIVKSAIARLKPKKPASLSYKPGTPTQELARKGFFEKCASKNFKPVYDKEQYNKIFWEFRKAQGWSYKDGEHIIPEEYWSMVRRFSERGIPKNARKVVLELASEETISQVRQRGRMRKKGSDLKPEELQKLGAEAKAVFTWYFRSLFE
jgi:hypothetical protein